MCSKPLLNDGTFISALNHTFITLILKKKKSNRITNFCSISLCNVIYKLTMKLANKIKLVLNKIVSCFQSVFVSSKLIIDNVLIAYKKIHFLENKIDGKLRSLSIKLDISKTYDIFDWDYLEAVMFKMGFNQKYTKLVMLCVRTNSFLILVNDLPTRPTLPII